MAVSRVVYFKAFDEDVIGIGIASTGKYIVSCSNKTDLVVWDLRGHILARLDTYLMNTSCVKISPCGRFILACGKCIQYQFIKKTYL